MPDTPAATWARAVELGARGSYAEAETQLAEWVRNGELVMREQIERGVENFPRVLQMLMTGGHHGKLLLAV